MACGLEESMSRLDPEPFRILRGIVPLKGIMEKRMETTIMENQMEKKMENEMETGII